MKQSSKEHIARLVVIFMMIVVVTVLCGFRYQRNKEEQYINSYQRGIALMDAGNYEAAGICFEQSLQQKYAKELQSYCEAKSVMDESRMSSVIKAQIKLKDIGEAYQGAYQQEIAEFRQYVNGILEEQKERIRQRQAG